MLRLLTAVLAAVLFATACGGDSPPQATRTPMPGETPAGQPTEPPPPPDGSDETLTTGDIAGALAALEEQGSWTFSSTFYLEGYEQAATVSGIERRQPELAVDAQHDTELGNHHYVRIDDDLWVSLGDGRYGHSLASESPNLVVQYEPQHLAGVIATTTSWRRGVEYDYVGSETVNGINTLHFRLNEFDRESLTERNDLEPDQWAGDVWIAADGGYLVRFMYGPQTPEHAQLSGPFGVAYDVTEVGCECPVEQPE